VRLGGTIGIGLGRGVHRLFSSGLPNSFGSIAILYPKTKITGSRVRLGQHASGPFLVLL